ncbi:MAG: hypothetical protein LBC17_00735 [Lactobacillaceae bacterium]|jgi:hypothetical protein|nr:hypothetical protein [Lactobacillaceae bacterium]
MNDLKLKANTVNKINAWNMILSIATTIFSVIFFVVFVILTLKYSDLDDASSAVISNSKIENGGLVILMLFFFLLLIALAIASFVLSIISAVQNNNFEIKQAYRNAKQGTVVPVLSILQIFFLRTVFSIVVYLSAKKVLTSNDIDFEDDDL